MGKVYAWFNTVTGECEIETTWPACQAKTKGKKGIRFKSFKNEAGATEWLKSGAEYEVKKEIQKNEVKATMEIFGEAIFFDAGTGRKTTGTEVRVTNATKESLLYKVVASTGINEFGNVDCGERTNNFGELLGLYFALQIAIQDGVKVICGDSKLVIDHWSNGKYSDKIATETKELIKEVIELKTRFLKWGGQIVWISGDHNVADIGWHRKS
jgi:ribonuclease H-related protein